MNMTDLISFNGIQEGAPPEMRAILNELVKRLEDFRVQMFDQLRAQPDIYHCDPSTDAGKKATQGAKAGDIAVWRGADNMDHCKILGLPVPQAATPLPAGAGLTTDTVVLNLGGRGTQAYYIRDGKLTLT